MKLGDYDVWYQPCKNCGHDTGKSTKPEDGFKACWKCGHSIERDYTDRALKDKELIKKLTKISDDQIYAGAVELWGHDQQLDMVQEECIELALAIRKYRRSPNNKTYDNLCEELADVMIMLSQVEEMGNLIDDIMPHKQYKLNRLRNKLLDNGWTFE